MGKTRRNDLTGLRFGRWTVIEFLGGGKKLGKSRGEAHWLCRCDCGTLKEQMASTLVRVNSQSCGCLRAQTISNKLKTHGMTGTPEYATWQQMRQRCFNEKHGAYPNYGGRGITVCDHWLVFENFFADMGKKPVDKRRISIERINNNGNYEPGNCKWATPYEQSNNQRRADMNKSKDIIKKMREEQGL